jgi:hypothetical protein
MTTRATIVEHAYPIKPNGVTISFVKKIISVLFVFAKCFICQCINWKVPLPANFEVQKLVLTDL